MPPVPSQSHTQTEIHLITLYDESSTMSSSQVSFPCYKLCQEGHPDECVIVLCVIFCGLQDIAATRVAQVFANIGGAARARNR
jgi:hypothetical protein